MLKKSQTHQNWKDGYVEDQRDFFNHLITDDWETYHLSQWNKSREFEVKQILTHIPFPRSILDVGCGCGYHDDLFAQHPQVEEVIGIDTSIKSIEQANRYYPHPKINRFVADIFNLQDVQHLKEKFDLVASFQVIEHLNNAKEFIKICATKIQSSGYVAVVTPNRDSLHNRIRLFLGKKTEMVDPLHFKEYSISDLISLGTQLGLTPKATFAHSFHISIGGYSINSMNPWISFHIAQKFPYWADVIGIVFTK